MNKQLVKQLSEKWSNPGRRPAKGKAFSGPTNCHPCAQSDAVMVYRNLSPQELYSALKIHEGIGEVNTTLLDKSAAKSLGISTIHAILLRRFNDYSSENPIIPLESPEKVLGPNFKKVLEFWHYIDSLGDRDWERISDKVSLYTYDLSRKAKAENLEKSKSREKSLKSLLSHLNVITPDLFYKGYGLSSEPIHISKAKEDDKLEVERLMGPGIPPQGKFGWSSARDYGLSHLPSYWHRSIPFALAYATSEIQCSESITGQEKWFFCNLFNYNPDSIYNPVTTVAKKLVKNIVGKTKHRAKPVEEPVSLSDQSGSLPVLTLKTVTEINPLSEINYFIHLTNAKGSNSAIVAFPKPREEDFSKNIMDRVRYGFEDIGIRVEEIGESNIRTSTSGKGLTCWKMSWSPDHLTPNGFVNYGGSSPFGKPRA